MPLLWNSILFDFSLHILRFFPIYRNNGSNVIHSYTKNICNKSFHPSKFSTRVRECCVIFVQMVLQQFAIYNAHSQSRGCLKYHFRIFPISFNFLGSRKRRSSEMKNSRHEHNVNPIRDATVTDITRIRILQHRIAIRRNWIEIR